MELQTNHTAITAAAPVESLLQEQGLELDYVLPDYYPDVCKLVKCFVTPSILSESVSGDKLTYELRAEVRILYCSEGSNLLQCVTQTLLFSRTAELPAGEQVTAELFPAVDYVNCRAVSRRRLDVRGAVTVRIRTTADTTHEVLTAADGKGMQLRRVNVMFPVKHFHAVQSLILTEDLELGSTQPPLLHVVRCEALPSDLTQKWVSGKLHIAGNLRLQILYACERDGDGSLEPLSFTLPFSQMLDVDDIEEQDTCTLSCTVASCDLQAAADGSGDIRSLRCEAELRVHCDAVRIRSESLLCDAFSTEHPCTCQTLGLLTSEAPVPFSEMQVCSTRIPCTDGAPDCVYDAWCEVRSINGELADGEVLLTGMLRWCVLVREADGMPRLLESEEPFEHRFSPAVLGSDDRLSVRARVGNCAYTLSGASEVTLKAELRMEGTTTHCSRVQVLSGITLDETTTQPHDFALKLYYASAGEPLWDIAKRCHTSVEAILEENDLAQDTLTESGMLLIPIV